MIRSSSKGSRSSNNISSVLSKLRYSLTKNDNPCTDRISQSKKRRNNGSDETHTSLSGLKNNSQKKRISWLKDDKINSLRGLSKTSSGTNTLRNSRKFIKPKNPKSILEQQFYECISKLDHSKHTHIGENECFLDYRCFVTIMSQMNYLSNWKEDNSLIDQMWKELGGEQYGGFLRSNLLLFLEIIQQVSEINKGLKPSTIGLQQNCPKAQKKSKVLAKYQRFRINRMEYQGVALSLNSTSDIKFQKQKQEETEGNLKRLRNSLLKKECYTKSKMQVKLKKKPQIKQVKRCKNKSYRVSFQLNVNPKIKQSRISKNIEQDKQNRDRELDQKTMCETNIGCNQYCDPKQKRLALLSLDLNLGQGRTDKIIIYQGDTPESIAQSLSLKHHLNSQVCSKFEKVLHSHINNVLSKIQEVSELTEDLCGSQREI